MQMSTDNGRRHSGNDGEKRQGADGRDQSSELDASTHGSGHGQGASTHGSGRGQGAGSGRGQGADGRDHSSGQGARNGRGQGAGNGGSGNGKPARRTIFRVSLAAFVAIFAVSAFFVARQLIRTKVAASEFNEISQTLRDMVASYERDAGAGSAENHAADDAGSGTGADGASGTGGDAADGDSIVDGHDEMEAQPISPQQLAYMEMQKEHPDFVGWLRIPGTVVDYPVMHTPADPEYYLASNFFGKRSSHGTPFLDYRCDPAKPSDNMTIYGHHMQDGSMFAVLERYKSKEFYESHKTIEFDTAYGIGDYEVIAAFVAYTSASGAYAFEYYNYVDFYTIEEFGEYMEALGKYQIYDTGETAQFGDRLLSLSTCDYTGANSRMVVVARQAR
ncbi:MAG: class B sortase [Oscillospiraceae bacterium]|nr:class B sortase [Oscillospiraceae bacterium]